jgi:hypothetical protein
MRRSLLSLAAVIAVLLAWPSAAANVPASPVPGAIPLYPEDDVGSAGDEVWTKLGPMTVIRNVTRPELTPILPAPGKATGAAVIIAPGAG